MRIAAIYEWKHNIRYRTQNPLDALERRGHEIAYCKEPGAGRAPVLYPERLAGCDVIHGYRVLMPPELHLVQARIDAGAAFVWDTDDDLSALPKESPYYRKTGGLRGQRTFAQTVRIGQLADVVTTSSERLAKRYRDAGIERVEVLGNYLAPEVVRSRQRKHEGFVIGWTAGLEHRSELARIPLEAALRRLLELHDHVRVASIGVELDLPRDRYEHIPLIELERLQEVVGRWDLGIAPLSDIDFNRSRSDVKLKEYASVGIPWLASPVGPYVGLGEDQGGRLVADDAWLEALDGLVRDRRAHARLGRRARRWAKSQSIDRVADRWERVCGEAIECRRMRG